MPEVRGIQVKVSSFDYRLPEELIAQYPVRQRDSSRLLILRRHSEKIEHRIFGNIVEYLNPGDTLVLNETRVIPARLFGNLVRTGRLIEVLLLKSINKSQWEALVKPGRKMREGDTIDFEGEMLGRVIGGTAYGGRVIEFEFKGKFRDILDRVGKVPLPPYIARDSVETDRERYQTVYATKDGSAAAPTAGLHFTDELLDSIKKAGVNIVKILLHVGLDTFRPVKVDKVEDHRMHKEYYSLDRATADTINKTKTNGKRVIAVGTTVARCLETLGNTSGFIKSGSGWTGIFIFPGYKFKILDGLVTNFHLPKSTLLMLVSALAGREKVLEAYGLAVEMKYRFFSYGDAMLIL